MVIGAGLFAAFPDVYAVFLGAFYLPVLLLLFRLIFRGVRCVSPIGGSLDRLAKRSCPGGGPLGMPEDRAACPQCDFIANCADESTGTARRDPIGNEGQDGADCVQGTQHLPDK